MDPGIATDDEKSQLAEWKKYRIPVNWGMLKKHRILTDRGGGKARKI
ncbi:tail fiber assembly protein [Salmonella enterica subsp. enterica serovar Newport]|nr:tail fiber assembly protein [Salmonella enterica subsp. enterica serovar Newport]